MLARTAGLLLDVSIVGGVAGALSALIWTLRAG